MKEKLKKVSCDFHVHTPSSNCYSEKVINDKLYMEILYTAINKKIDVICITDHNTLHGYFKIIEIIDELKKEYEILNKHNAISDSYNETKNNLDKLNNLYIIPGIEITVDPGIHIILLFDKNRKSEELRDFCKTIKLNVDHPADSRDGTDIDVLKLLELAKEFGCITIAPHIDSDKGIYNSLENFGDYRAKIFKSEFLDAVTCNSEIIKNKVIELTNNDKNYKRTTPLAFINGSDAHNLAKIGEIRTFIEIDSESIDTFSLIKTAILHSSNSISTTENFDTEIKILKVKKSKRFLCIENFDKEEICKTLCATLNSNFGAVLIGVKKNEKLCGISLEHNKIIEEIKNSFKSLGIDYDSPFFSVDVLDYKISKYIIILSLININNVLFCYNDKAYFANYKSKETYEASPHEIENYVKNKIYNEIRKIENKNNKIVDSIMKSITMVSKSYYCLTLKEKFETNGKLLLNYISKVFSMEKNSEITYIDNLRYGEKEGNNYFSPKSDIRLENTILRYTCPVCTKIDIDKNNIKVFEPGEYIVIKKTGASLYINNVNKWYYFTSDDDDIILKLDKVKTKMLLAWLKSSLFAYSFYNMKPDNFRISNYVPFIITPDFNNFENEKEKEIIKLVDLIIEKEKEFLENIKKYENLEIDDNYIKEFSSICNSHNKEINSLTKEIDTIFIYALHINEKEKEYISDVLRQNKVFDLYNVEDNEI